MSFMTSGTHAHMCIHIHTCTAKYAQIYAYIYIYAHTEAYTKADFLIIF